MPKAQCTVSVLPLKVLCHQVISLSRAKENDFYFIIDILEDSATPDYNGYNTHKARSSGQSPTVKTDSRYRPLINTKPSDPSTILTAMTDVETLSYDATQVNISLFLPVINSCIVYQ